MALWNVTNFVTLATTASTYSAHMGDIVVAPAALGQNCTVNLPPVSTGAQVAVKNLSTNPYTLTVKTTDSSKIDNITGSTGVTLSAEYDTLVLASDGANWFVMSGGAAEADD